MNTIVHELYNASKDSGTFEFIRYEGVSYSFDDLLSLVEKYASTLIVNGINQGDRVGVYLPNGPEWVAAWLGILRAGAIAVPVNRSYESQDLQFVLKDSGAKAVFTDRRGYDKISGAIDIKGDNIVVFDVNNDIYSDVEFDRLPNMSSIAAESIANFQYTSGTTGFPKACMLDHSYWHALGGKAAELVNAKRGEVTITTQPFSYMDPLWNVALCLVARCTLVVKERFSASNMWRWVREEGVNFFYVLGTMPTLLFKQPPCQDDLNHNVRAVTCSAIPRNLHAALEERWGVPWREVFGMTETGIDLYVPWKSTELVGTGSVGWPVESKDAGIFSPEDVRLGCGDVGELAVKGHPMMRGYWNRPEATDAALRNGWFHTGDLAEQMADGSFRFVGRLKDMVRRGGENVSAAEVESAANRHEKVVASAVVPVPDELWGERVKLIAQIVNIEDSSQELADDIQNFLRAQLAKFKLPEYIGFVDVFPMTPSERIIKKKIPLWQERKGQNIFTVGTGD